MTKINANYERRISGFLQSRDQFRRFMNGEEKEFRALASEVRELKADSDVQGGYLLQNELLGILQNQASFASVIRRLATLTPVEAPAGYEVSWPSLTTRPSAAEWLPEGWAITPDSATRIGEESHVLHRLTKLIQVSKKLIRSPFAEKVVLMLLGIAKGVAEENAYISGTGVGQPVGILEDPNLVTVTTAESGALETNDLFEFTGALPDAYREDAAIVTTADFWKKVLKLGQPQFNSWETCLNIPLHFSDGMPAILSSGSLIADEYAAILADFKSAYWIGEDSIGPSIQILKELYAEANEVGFIMESYIDGHLTDPNALVALKIKA